MPGTAFLTGPYKGAPFGIAIIVPALAGPFDLGTVVIRQALYIDPNDAHVTDVSDPFPTILHGIPLRIQRVDVTIDRPEFMLNPTSCEAQQVTGAATSIPGGQASLSTRFQATGCRELPFKPVLTATTKGKASRSRGASLTVKVTAKHGEANIHRVDLQLPRALPSRDSTLKLACLQAVFAANPANCPPGSIIGYATAHTPILTAPLTGPAIIVSHGSAAFPDVEFLLQSEGVKIVLDGKTNIEHGITYSMFETVPDAPITSFETTLPEGPHSILGAFVTGNTYNLCGHKLVMPTTITGQNGAVIRKATNVAIAGCLKHKASKKHANRRTTKKGRS